MHVNIVRSLCQFLEITDSWNQLWRDSQSHVALHRAEPIARFVETYGLSDQFAAITIHDQNRLVFGLPLFIKRNRWGQQVGYSVANEWFLQACLLKAAHADASSLMMLAQAFKDLGLLQVKLNWLPLDWPSSQALTEVWSQSHQVSWMKPRFEVSYWSVPADWNDFWHNLHAKRRKKYLGFEKKLAADGPIQLIQYDGLDLERFDEHFDQVLNVEHAGWKGRSGTSLRSNPNLSRMYYDTYRELASHGLLRIYLLTVGSRPIAVDLGYLVAGVYSSQKVSYLEEYSKFTPGQLLNARLFEQWSQTSEVRFVDCIGEVSDATLKWGSDTYRTGQLTLSTGTFLSKASVFALDSIANLMGRNTLSSRA
jgi:CelD/BcsL family acetyltransferase involved in cellulose biosynthesis